MKRTKNDDLRTYAEQFQNVSGALVSQNQLDKFTEALWFLQGLPRDVAEHVRKKAKISKESPETMKLGIACEKLYELLDEEEENIELFEASPSNQYTSLANAYQPALPKRTDLRIQDHPPTVPVPSTGKMDAKIDALTEQLRTLSINQQKMMEGQFYNANHNGGFGMQPRVNQAT